MSTMVVVLVSSVMVLAVVIGLIDGLVHLLGWAARSALRLWTSRPALTPHLVGRRGAGVAG